MEFVARISRTGRPGRWLADTGPVEDIEEARRFSTITEAVLATRAWWLQSRVPLKWRRCYVAYAPEFRAAT